MRNEKCKVDENDFKILLIVCLSIAHCPLPTAHCPLPIEAKFGFDHLTPSYSQFPLPLPLPPYPSISSDTSHNRRALSASRANGATPPKSFGRSVAMA